jgi:stage III sporulation protein AB
MIAVKLAASALVLGSCGGLARRAQNPYTMRVAALDQWQKLIRHLLPLIGWQRIPLRAALAQASQGLSTLHRPMQSLAASLLSPDADFGAEWRRMLASIPGLWEEDRRALDDLGQTLGRSEAAHQEDQLNAALAEVGRLLNEARAQKGQDGRLMPALVAASGVLVVILLL